jgi:nucleosome binding factor SPN SPT16 subunit
MVLSTDLHVIARILSQIKEGDNVVPVELFIQAKGKAAPSEALIQFSELFLSKKRIGTLTKESYSGALMTEWSKRIDEAATKPELVDTSHAVSGFMAVKDAEELVGVGLVGSLLDVVNFTI